MARRITSDILTQIAALQICMQPTLLILLLLLVSFGADGSRALPAFAEQVGVPCSTCHVGGFGLQLTAFGREFKLGGYTLRASSDFTMPFAAMMIDSYVKTRKHQASPAPHYGPNDNATID